MWNDIETTNDLLNFRIVADTAAQLIRDSGNEPLSIGISGSWGSGKSSLVKMIGKSLDSGAESEQKYLFLEFNAWLYQGFDDAKMALLQSVSDMLLAEANKQKTLIDKSIDLVKRVRWFKVLKLGMPIASSALLGGAVGGPIGAVVGALGGFLKNESVPSQEEFLKVQEAYKNLEPELQGLLKNEETTSLPKEIASLRQAFEEILEGLNIKLVVLVDDLDRCMPDTAISTLEAMRLLLFLPRTAFIIAADEKMIRSAVRSHFSNLQIDDELVTSYFDKLIQVPLRVPRLGVSEVKAYLILLFAEQAVKKGNLSQEVLDEASEKILDAVKKPWLGGLKQQSITEAFGTSSSSLEKQIDIAEQLAHIMATTEQLAGNPRLIKRFLNNLIIRETIANTQGMGIAFEELVKLQLFERCASPRAFEFLAKKVSESDDGKVEFLIEIEEKLKNSEEYEIPDQSWKDPFIEEWLQIKPLLSNIDLRPLLHLSREKMISLSGVDELSQEAKSIYEALLVVKSHNTGLITNIQSLPETEASQILIRLKRKLMSEDWNKDSLQGVLHLTKAYPSLVGSVLALLSEIPEAKRLAPLIPTLSTEEWAKDILLQWSKDDNTPERTKKAIQQKFGGK
ncbi:P-loop NTPase fold protein [Sulfuricurvum sp.]|uniref:KAP family P-loop NTPase fold protein n=1 Tax=Sulfuricurvum sp. TaxID=2025608 RepID=UPI002615122C|nr:P-loop NTPase fold protein [Sulfuricurvum sp.]MDD2781351.1 P-loop NTPase fold protein [Sulfuricurvum sp.]